MAKVAFHPFERSPATLTILSREEPVSAERIRQIVSEVLGKRIIDRGGSRIRKRLILTRESEENPSFSNAA